MQKDFFIGIDLGTDSVGWAVTDREYNLIKARGQDLWGSYLFDEAEGAKERRMHRTARRRTARTRQRLQLLQSLFAEEVAKIDPPFFLRLNNSSLFFKDKDGRLTTSDSLFSDLGFSDKQYYAKFPTIYHLRAALLSGEVTDIRLLYLALHHIIKNRGHFFFEAQSFETGDAELVKQKFCELNAMLSDLELPVLSLDRLDEVLDCLRKRAGGKRDRQKILAGLLGAGKEKNLSAIIKAMTGGNASLKELYGAEDEFENMKSFSFESASFDEKDFSAIEGAVGEDNVGLVLTIKSIYDWSVLCGIMGEEKYISLAKVKRYEKHRADLKWLKEYIRKNCPQKYKEVFRSKSGANNYAAYIGMDKQKGFKKCKKEDFYAFLKKSIQISDEDVLSEMEKGEFLPKQVSNANGVIPYQVHLL